jgi:hypothetical protein
LIAGRLAACYVEHEFFLFIDALERKRPICFWEPRPNESGVEAT